MRAILKTVALKSKIPICPLLFLLGFSPVLSSEAAANGRQCNLAFWNRLDSTAKKLEGNQDSARKLEASNCQSAIAYHAIDSRREARAIQESICRKEESHLSQLKTGTANTLNQVESQASATSLAAQKKGFSEEILALLIKEKEKIRLLRARALALNLDEACWNSTEALAYKAETTNLEKNLGEFESHLDSYEKEKTAEIESYGQALATGATNQEHMKTAGSSASTGTSAPKLPKEKSSLQKNAPLAALLGVPLTGLLLGNGLGSGGGPMGLKASDLGGSSTGFTNDCTVFQGGNPEAYIRNAGLKLSDSARALTEDQKKIIAAAAQAIPACYKPYLRNLMIHSNPTMKFSEKAGKELEGKCLPGLRTGSGVTLNFTCDNSRLSGVAVHEFFHEIDARLGRNPSLKRHMADRSCPVSEYSSKYRANIATFAQEDFADAMRIAICGKGSASTRSDPCVGGRIEHVKKEFLSPPNCAP